MLGDGCLQEGVASEAASLAGHLKLGKLIAIYDDNHITIDGDTAVSFTEDVIKRFEAYDWHTIVVGNGDSDFASIEKALTEAHKVRDKPTIIKVRTTIGMLMYFLWGMADFFCVHRGMVTQAFMHYLSTIINLIIAYQVLVLCYKVKRRFMVLLFPVSETFF